MTCVYLGEKEQNRRDDLEVYSCRLFDRCVLGRSDGEHAGCRRCKRYLAFDSPDFNDKWVDPLIVLDRHRERTGALRGMLGGQSVFLACGGPSANDLPLEKLNRRGIWTMCVNNMAGHSRFRPQAFVCSDPPVKFSHSIWLDKAIMKFVPTPKMKGRRAKLKRKMGDKQFVQMKEAVTDCPNVWGFQRHSWFVPGDDFFLTDGACWGNHNAGCKKTGEKKTVCTMLLPLRLLRYLGARRVYLIGVDFRMSSDYGYSFSQEIRHKEPKEGEARYDNGQYEVVNEWLCKMQEEGVFERFGMEIFNCFRLSSLRAFPFVPFSEAIIDVVGEVEEKPDLGQWYDWAKK